VERRRHCREVEVEFIAKDSGEISLALGNNVAFLKFYLKLFLDLGKIFVVAKCHDDRLLTLGEDGKIMTGEFNHCNPIVFNLGRPRHLNIQNPIVIPRQLQRRRSPTPPLRLRPRR
jgi:hypothetical protein